MIVPANKIVVRVIRHVGGGYRNIFVPGDVYSSRIVRLIIHARGNRKAGNVASAMIENGMYIRWKDRLRLLVGGNRWICPPQERLWLCSAVIQLYIYLQVGFSWIECEASRHFRPVHAVNFADPDRSAAIGVVANSIFNRSERIRAMMLRPVKLDSARNP